MELHVPTTSRDQVARLTKPTTPYLGHLDVRSRSRRGKEDNEVIGSLCETINNPKHNIDNYQVI
jgi:hypothetical protein